MGKRQRGADRGVNWAHWAAVLGMPGESGVQRSGFGVQKGRPGVVEMSNLEGACGFVARVISVALVG